MSHLSIKNPLINSVANNITLNKKAITIHGTSLSTGINTNNDVVSSFLGNKLADKSKILDTIYRGIGYGSNIIRTAEDGLSSIASTLLEMQGIANSVNGSQTSIRTLNDIFQQKLQQVEKQTNTVKFDGIKLLTGEFGSDPSIKSKYNTKIVDVRKTGEGAGTLFEGEGTRAIKIIDVQDVNKIKEGDTINLNGVTFKMIQAQNASKNKEVNDNKPDESSIVIGSTEEETVANIATSLKNHSSESMRLYDITTYNKQVIVRQRSCSTAHIPLIINSENGGVCDNSDPSSYSLEFQQNPTIGCKLTIAGITFEFVDNGTAGSDITKVEIQNYMSRTAKKLYDVIYNHPTIKDLIDQNFISIESVYGASGIIINSVFNGVIVNFHTEFPINIMKDNIFKVSQNNKFGYRIKIINAPAIGDVRRLTRPDGTIQDYVINHNMSAYVIHGTIYDTFLQEPGIGINNPNDLMQKANCCIKKHRRDHIIDIYTNYDMQLQYIPINPNDPRMIITPAPISSADVSKIKPAINVSNLRNFDEFLGKPKVSVQLIEQATSAGGNESAKNLYQQVKGGEELPTVSTNGDIATLLHANIAGRTFQSVVWQGNGDNLNNRELVFTEPSTGESFSINTKNLNANLTTLEDSIETLVKPIEKLLSTTEFTQIRDIDIDNSESEITDKNGAVIGNTKNMSVSLNSCSFDNKQFEDFTIKEDPVTKGNIILTATINGEEFSCSAISYKLSEGRAFTLKGLNGDSLTINIGKNGIKILSPENYSLIASGIKKSLMKIGLGIDIRIGSDVNDNSKLFIPNISANKIYHNNQNEYVPNLDLLSKENVKTAQEVISNALNSVRLAQTKLQGQSNNLNEHLKRLDSITSITKDASSSYLDTDLIEPTSNFSSSLKKLLASISTLQAGAKVADAGLEIIRSVSTI